MKESGMFEQDRQLRAAARRMSVITVLFLAFGLQAQQPPAVPLSPNDFRRSADDFIRMCQSVNASDTMMAACNTYVTGVVDGASLNTICVPPTTTRANLYRNTIAFIEKHPEKRQMTTVDVILEATATRFPCAPPH